MGIGGPNEYWPGMLRVRESVHISAELMVRFYFRPEELNSKEEFFVWKHLVECEVCRGRYARIKEFYPDRVEPKQHISSCV